MITRTSGLRQGERQTTRRTDLHIHWFRWQGHDPFSGSSLYACRCGIVRPGL